MFNTKLCQKITDVDDTFIGVKGQQRSYVVNYVLWQPHWSEVSLIQAKHAYDLYGSYKLP